MFEQKCCFALQMFEQKSCFAPKMFEQKSFFAPKMFEQKFLLQTQYNIPQHSTQSWSTLRLAIHGSLFWGEFTDDT